MFVRNQSSSVQSMTYFEEIRMLFYRVNGNTVHVMYMYVTFHATLLDLVCGYF